MDARDTLLVVNVFLVRLFDLELDAPALFAFGFKEVDWSIKLTRDTSTDFLATFTSFPLIIFSFTLFLDPDLVFPDVVEGANLLTFIGAGIIFMSVSIGMMT